MANLNVTYQDLRDAAKALTGGRDDLDHKLTELSNLVNTLTANGFQAEQSSAAYRDAFENFRSGTSTAIGGLEGLSSFLVQAADALEQTDQGLASGIRG
jgi:WXG100 family type VII secretion target